MKKRQRLSIATAIAAALAALAACDDSKPPEPPPNPDIGPELRINIPMQQRPLSANPAAVNGEGPVSSGVAPLTIRVLNPNQNRIKLHSVQLAGSASSFNISGTCGHDLEIASTGNCTVIVAPVARLPGTFEASVLVNYEKMQEPLKIDIRVTLQDDRPAQLPVVRQHVEAPPPPPPPIVYDPGPYDSLVNARRSLREGGIRAQLQEGPLLPNQREVARTQRFFAGASNSVASLPVDTTRILTRDTIIPAVLYNPILGGTNGQAIAVVSRHVYGGDGQTILVHAGSRIIGSYISSGQGQNYRARVAWDEILTPNGISVRLGAGTTGTDAMGQSGIPGEYYSRFLDRFGAALMVSAINAGTLWGLGGNNSSTVTTNAFGGTREQVSPRDRALQSFAEDVRDVSRRMIEEGADRIRPTVIVAGGTRINIMLVQNLYFRTDEADFAEVVTAEAERERRGGVTPASLATGPGSPQEAASSLLARPSPTEPPSDSASAIPNSQSASRGATGIAPPRAPRPPQANMPTFRP